MNLDNNAANQPTVDDTINNHNTNLGKKMAKRLALIALGTVGVVVALAVVAEKLETVPAEDE